jgi:NADH dehydrogenase
MVAKRSSRAVTSITVLDILLFVGFARTRDRDNFFPFTPMLHEVAASDLELTTIVNRVRKLLKKVQLFAGEVERIDLHKNELTLSHEFQRHTHTVRYDQLVLALGSIPNFHNLPGLAERAITMKTLGDAVALRNRLIAHLEEADTDCTQGEREPLLTFVAPSPTKVGRLHREIERSSAGNSSET